MNFQAYIQDYLDGELTEQQQAELSDWLEQNEANRETFVRASILDSQIHRQLTQSELNQFLDQVDIHSLQSAMAQSTSSGSGAFAAMIQADPNQNTAAQDRNDLSLGQSLGILTHAGTAFASKRLRQHAMTIALAAAIVLALTLALVFRGEDTPAPNQQVSDFVQTPDEVEAPAPIQAVATLTASQNATWAEGALAPGSDLRPGQRLTLTAGFAEITTNHGAVAVLEAPATIELINNDNALHLHAGKLVGICETETSQGFAVSTPRMDVIDLGTRFGVSVEQTGESLVQVFDGVVVAKPNVIDQSTSIARELGAGESLAVDHRGQEVKHDPAGTQTFARLAAQIGGVARLTGDVAWSTPEQYIGKDISSWPKEAKAVVFPEHPGLTLTKALQTSSLSLDASELPKPVLPGTVIRTYILLYQPAASTPTWAEGSVTFEGEILGVIFHDNWNASLQALKNNPEVDVFNVDQLTGTVELYDFDKVEISPDRHELTFNLKASLACDAMRIVVRESVGEPN